jgi:hypothetical protein
MSDDRQPVVPWQMVFAILGLVGGITTTWVTLKEEVVSLKKDISFLEHKLGSVEKIIMTNDSTSKAMLDKLDRQIELLQSDIQQMRIVRSKQ